MGMHENLLFLKSPSWVNKKPNGKQQREARTQKTGIRRLRTWKRRRTLAKNVTVDEGSPSY